MFKTGGGHYDQSVWYGFELFISIDLWGYFHALLCQVGKCWANMLIFLLRSSLLRDSTAHITLWWKQRVITTGEQINTVFLCFYPDLSHHCLLTLWESERMLMMMMMMKKKGSKGSLAVFALLVASANCILPPSKDDLNGKFVEYLSLK